MLFTFSIVLSLLYFLFQLNLDEREDVQKKTFGKWINSQLVKVRIVFGYNLIPRVSFNSGR